MERRTALSEACVVLSRPSHAGNIGSAARAMKTMGFDDLRLVAPKDFPSANANALASGALDVLERARVFATLEEALGDAVLAVGFSSRPRDLSHPVRALREAAGDIVAQSVHGRVALVFGNETFGLTNEELARCQWLATIPANPRYASLNLAAAVQVACYELAVAAAQFSPAAEPDRGLLHAPRKRDGGERFPRPRAAQAPDGAHAAALREGGARARGGALPARHAGLVREAPQALVGRAPRCRRGKREQHQQRHRRHDHAARGEGDAQSRRLDQVAADRDAHADAAHDEGR
jgi:tRNA/rRNA methyltransferase